MCHIAGFLPSVVEGSAVLVVAQTACRDVFHLIKQHGVECLSSVSIAKVEVHREAFVSKAGSHHAFHLGAALAHYHFILAVEVVGVFAFLGDKHFLTGSGVDTGRTHCPDVIGVGAIVIALGAVVAASFGVKHIQAIAYARQFALIASHVGSYTPPEAIGHASYDVIRCLHIVALGGLLAKVLIHHIARGTCRWRHGYAYQQRVGGLVIVVTGEGEAVVEQSHVETDIAVERGLPLQIGVTKLIERGGHSEIVKHIEVISECGDSGR